MKIKFRRLSVAALTLCLCGCAATSMKQTWKSPTYHGGPVQKVAVLAVDERGLVRQGFENRFAWQLNEHGQSALVTHDLLGLSEIKADQQAATARVRQAGADSVLLVRLVDRATYDREVRATPEAYTVVVTGYESGTWYGYYSIAYMDMGTVWSNTKTGIYLDTSLFDLKSGQRLWSGVTLTVLKDDTDRLEEADLLVAKVLAALRKDGLVR